MDDTEVGNVSPTSNVAKKHQESGITYEESKPKAKVDAISKDESTFTWTLEYISAVLRFWKEQKLTTEIAMTIASTVELAPYLPEEMKEEMRRAARGYKMASDDCSSALKAFSSSSATATSSTSQEAYKSISEEQKSTEAHPMTLEGYNETPMTVDGLLALMAKKDELLAKERAFRELNGFESAFSDMIASFHKAMKTLDEFGSLSQAERSLPPTSTAVEKESHVDDDVDDDGKDNTDANKDETNDRESNEAEKGEQEVDQTKADENQDATNYKPVLAGERKLATKLCESISPLDHTQYMILPGSNNELLQRGLSQLQKVAEYWSSWIKNCHIIPGTASSKDAKAIEDVIQNIRGTLKNPDASPEPDLQRPCPFASLLSQEVNGTQPVFVGLLQLIGDCCDECIDSNGYSDGYSQPKTRVMTSQRIHGTDSRQERIVDVCMDKPGRLRIQTDDMEQKLTCELKPLLRKATSLEDLHSESRHQALGHLAKYVLQGLVLYGCGAKTWATGLTATVAYVTVYRLDLTISEYTKENPDIVKLQLSESAKLPTISKDCYNMWAEKFLTQQGESLKPAELKQIQEQINSLREELYGNGSYASDSNPIPIGIRVLWYLMLQRRSGLFGPDYQDIIAPPDGQTAIGKLLGTGSFGLVFRYGQDEKSDEVLKVSRLRNCFHIERELAVLQALEREEGADYTIDDQVALPTLIHGIRPLTVKLGGVTRKLDGLVLSPKGTPVLSWLRMTLVDVRTGTFCKKVVGQLEKALIFMHEKGVYHNDVAPKNIIIRPMGHDDWNVWLVDFGCASYPKERKLTGFVGTLLYAHKYILNRRSKESWAPKPEHDFFSLGLTISVLINAGVTFWDMKRKPTDEAVTTRFTKASNLIESLVCMEEVKQKLLNWISAEKGSAAPKEVKKRPRSAQAPFDC